MRGEILSYDDVSGTGLISGDDSIRYGFARSAIQAGGVIRPGARVDFAAEGVEATLVTVLAADPAAAFGAAAASSYVARDTGGGYDIKSAMLSFKGRLRRQHFWISWAILLVLGIVCSFFPAVSFFLGLILLVPHLAIGFKRFHDMGKPGWLVVIPWVFWYGAMGMMVAAFGLAVITDPNAMQSMDPETLLATGGAAFGLMFLAVLVSLGFWLWLGIGDSQRGDNKYGPNPKGE